MVIYRIDGFDVFTFVNDDWDVFAAENSGAHLTREHILGESLWGHISDESTAGIYREILTTVRGGRDATVSFRCDAPELRRYYELAISGLPEDGIEFRVGSINVESRPPCLLLHPDVARTQELLGVCSWCKRVALEGAWWELERIVNELRLFLEPPLPGLTHGICPDCCETAFGSG